MRWDPKICASRCVTRSTSDWLACLRKSRLMTWMPFWNYMVSLFQSKFNGKSSQCFSCGVWFSSIPTIAYDPLSYWTSAKKIDGVWIWTETGDILANSNWGPGQPGNQTCLRIVPGGAWDDDDCTKLTNILCEDYPADFNCCDNSCNNSCDHSCNKADNACWNKSNTK